MGKQLRILMFRSWSPLPHAATFSTLAAAGVGATESQLLLHARALRELGHEVVVLGVTRSDVVEEDILFQGAENEQQLGDLIGRRHAETDVVFTNVTQQIGRLRQLMPRARLVQVCQNGPHFAADSCIDVYGFIGEGQLAYYSVTARKYRHKFMMLPNVVPWYSCYASSPPQPREHQVIWVGGFTKQGLRQYGKAMIPLLERDRSLKWVLCGPSYSWLGKERRPEALADLCLPWEQLVFKNLPLPQLALEIQRSKVMLGSLGGEDCGVAYLDGHALGVPVVCGDDIIGKWGNPEGMGLRCTTAQECQEAIAFLLAHPDVCERMGQAGRRWVSETLTEKQQKRCLEDILNYLDLRSIPGFPNKQTIQSDRKRSLRYWQERLEIKIARRRQK
jgi:hypothetical protein